MTTPSVRVNIRGRIVDAYLGMDGQVWIYRTENDIRRGYEGPVGQQVVASSVDAIGWLSTYAIPGDPCIVSFIKSIAWRYPANFKKFPKEIKKHLTPKKAIVYDAP